MMRIKKPLTYREWLLGEGQFVLAFAAVIALLFSLGCANPVAPEPDCIYPTKDRHWTLPASRLCTAIVEPPNPTGGI